MKLKFIIITVLLFVFLSSSASMSINPDGVVFADYQGKMYQVTNKDLGHVHELEKLDKNFIPQNDWHQIIANAEPKVSKRLLEKLTSYLPKKELWAYIETGLLRKENKFNNLVADAAYKQWEIFATHRELTKIRTNPNYRNNLSVLSNWNSLFAKPTKPMATLEQAIDRLTQYPTQVDYHDRRVVRELRTSIALSTDVEQLKKLAYHENMHIALASYYALSKLTPKEVAFDILSQAIFRTENIKYSYWSGGDVSIGGNNLTLGEAAYDLFSDYLNNDQILKIFKKDSQVDSNFGKLKFKIRSIQMANSFKKYYQNSNQIKRMLQEWDFEELIHNSKKSSLKNLVKRGRFLESLLEQPIITQRVVNALIGYEDEEQDNKITYIETWLIISFKSHNNESKRLVTFFISGKNPNVNIKQIIKSLTYQHNWPRDWQDLKQQVKELAVEYNISTND